MYHHKNYGGLNYVQWSLLAAGHHQVLGDFPGDSGGLHGGLTQPVLVLPQTSPGEGRVHEEQHHCTSRRGLWNVRLIDNSTVWARISKGWGVEEENFERKMFVDTRINACTHIKLDKQATLSLFFLFKRIVFYFFALFYYSLLFLKPS